MKKVGRFLIFGYLCMIFLPYLFVILMYVFLKKVAKPGSEVEAQVHELETELINLLLGLIHALDPNFILMNLSGVLLIGCIVYFLRKYKIIIPRRKAEKEL